MSMGQEYTTYLASIQANCDFQKLLNTFTTDITTLIPQIVARLSGGIIFEIPQIFSHVTKAKSCEEVGYWSAKLFSMVFDYYLS